MRLYSGLVALILIGVGLILASARYPRYSQPGVMDRFVDARPGSTEEASEMSRHFYETQGQFQTPHIYLLNGVSRLRDIVRMSTPASERGWRVLVNVACLLPIPAQVVYYTYTASRGDYPRWAGQVGIPIFSEAILGVVAAGFLNIWCFAWLRDAPLPVNLWFWPWHRSARKWVWTLVCGLLAVAIGDLMVESIISGDGFILPAYVLWLYLVLSIRSVNVSKEPSGYRLQAADGS